MTKAEAAKRIKALKQTEEEMRMKNVTIQHDNGAAFLVTVDGLITSHHNTLDGAWNQIKWMYEVASQKFTVGGKKILVTDWIEEMKKVGYLE